jgi:hypothetical protein
MSFEKIFGVTEMTETYLIKKKSSGGQCNFIEVLIRKLEFKGMKN